MQKSSASTLPSKAGALVLQLLKYGIAAFLILSGGAKLLGVEEMVALYHAIGFGQWFRYLSGGVEIVAAALILLPRWRVQGILLTVAIMIAGVVEHIFVLKIIPGAPAVGFAAVLVILYLTRPRLQPNS